MIGAIEPFRQRFPWLGPDLQTLRDTLRPSRLGPDRGRPLLFDLDGGEQLLALADAPAATQAWAGPLPAARAWVPS